MYTDETKAFLCFFPCKLHEWLSKLANSQGMWRLDDPILWTQGLVKHPKALENNSMQCFDHWIDHIIGGFVTKLMIDTAINSSEAERRIFKGP